MNLPQISTASKRSLFASAALALLTVAAPSAAQPLPGETEDPFHRIHRIDLEDGRVVGRSTSELPREAFSTGRGAWKVPPPSREPRPVDKIHHELRAMDLGSPERHRLIVTFQDDLRVPRFPVLVPGEPDDSPANRAALARAQELIREIEARRADGYAGLARELEAFDATVVETFWLIKAMVVEMPLSNVEALADRADVQAVEPEQTRDLPPQNASSLDDVQDGRAHILSDPYFNLNLISGNIALLDTGVRSTHTLFQGPARLRNLRDCVKGGPTCNAAANAGFTTGDVCNHGTSSAGIVSGNANLGDAFRGVTAIKVDSFRVYAVSTCFLDQTAATRGFQNAVALLNPVILAEIQATGVNAGAVGTAADAAFDAGSLVIAPNGNQGPNAGTVTSPASAHKTIGVGALAVQGLAQYSFQSRGPVPLDDRYKPDIQAPTDTETASNTSNSAFRIHTGTSGAAPYAAGAAALMRNWSLPSTPLIEPGQVYAQLIVSGQKPGQVDNTVGAGLIKLPAGGHFWWGKASISHGQVLDIPLTIPGATTWTLFDGALWWPESLAQDHNDIDLDLVDPIGAAVTTSALVDSVFERARVSSFLFPATTWKLRIVGYNVPVAPQTVYWAAYIH